MSCRSKLGKPMKVVHINTQYVETDACSFKSVVQDLTGRHSTIADLPSSSWVMKAKKEIKNEVPHHHQSRLARMSSYVDERPSPAVGQFMLKYRENGKNNINEDHHMMSKGGGSYSFLSRNLSYKEMDRLMKELPPLEDLHKILSFD